MSGEPGSPGAPPPPGGCGGSRTQRLNTAQIHESFRQLGFDVTGLPSGDPLTDYLHPVADSYRVDEVEGMDRIAARALTVLETKYGKRFAECHALADAAALTGCAARLWAQIAADLWGIGPADKGTAFGEAYVRLVGEHGIPTARQFVLRAVATDAEFLFLQRPAVIHDDRSLALFKRWASYMLTGQPSAASADARAAKPASAPAFLDTLLSKAEFGATAHRFYRNLLRLDTAPGLVKDNKLFPFYGIHFANGVLSDFQKHVSRVVNQPTAPFTAILFGPMTFEPALATAYADTETMSAYGRHARERVGALAHPAVLSSLSVTNDTAPLHNGLLFLDKVLCQLPPPPPLNPEDVPYTDDPKRSRRDNFEARTAGPACSGCHQTLNPVSFAFELFDASGRFRPSTDAQKYAANGQMRLASGKTIIFDNAMHLLKQVESEPQILECHARRWVEHFFGGPVGPETTCALEKAQSLAKAGSDLRTVIKGIVLPPVTL